MHDCGHTEQFRATIISRVVGKYKNNLENHVSGEKRMFRTKEERNTYILINGGKKTKSNWFRGDSNNTTTTSTVPTTPGGLLARCMQSTLDACPPPTGCRTKVLEGEGITVQRNIVRSNPFPRTSCGRTGCLLDKLCEGGCKERCFQEGVGYASTCTRCYDKQLDEGKPVEECQNYSYYGETSRTLYTRAKQHLEGYKSHQPARKPIESWMWDHTVSHHGGIMGENQGERDYQFRLQGKFEKPLTRQVDEAVRLGQVDRHGHVLDDVGGPWGGPVTSLNSRGEFYRPRMMQYRFEN